MNYKEYLSGFWNQYIKLENTFIDSTYYVNINEANMETYSYSFVSQILNLGSEIDNVWREMIGLTKRSDIKEYSKHIMESFPEITSQKVKVKDTEITLCPFMNWNINEPSQSLKFWDDYNLIKHDRITNFTKANLKTTIDILAATYITEMYRINEIYKQDKRTIDNFPEPDSKIFVLQNWEQHIRTSLIKSEYALFDDDSNERVL